MEAQRDDRRFARQGIAARADVSGRCGRLAAAVSTLLITGGAGFIGSNLVQHALDRTADRLVVVDNLTYAGSLANLEGPLKDPRVTFVRVDIGDRAWMTR